MNRKNHSILCYLTDTVRRLGNIIAQMSTTRLASSLNTSDITEDRKLANPANIVKMMNQIH